MAPWQSTRRSIQSRRVARKWGEVPTLSGAASGRLHTNCVTNSTFALAMDSSDMAPISSVVCDLTKIPRIRMWLSPVKIQLHAHRGDASPAGELIQRYGLDPCITD